LDLVVSVEVLHMVAGAVNGPLQLATLTIEVIHTEVIGGVVGNAVSSLPVLVSVTTLGEES